MSNEHTPTLSLVIPAFERFMSQWEKLIDKHPSLTEFIKPGLDSAVDYYAKMDKTRAYVIAMCAYFCTPCPRIITHLSLVINPHIWLKYIARNWDDGYQVEANDTIRATVSFFRFT